MWWKEQANSCSSDLHIHATQYTYTLTPQMHPINLKKWIRWRWSRWHILEIPMGEWRQATPRIHGIDSLAQLLSSRSSRNSDSSNKIKTAVAQRQLKLPFHLHMYAHTWVHSHTYVHLYTHKHAHTQNNKNPMPRRSHVIPGLIGYIWCHLFPCQDHLPNFVTLNRRTERFIWTNMQSSPPFINGWVYDNTIWVPGCMRDGDRRAHTLIKLALIHKYILGSTYNLKMELLGSGIFQSDRTYHIIESLMYRAFLIELP